MQQTFKRFTGFVLAALLAVLTVIPAFAGVGMSTAQRNTIADSITTTVGNAGTLKYYTATQPATCAAITTQTLLATHTLGTPLAAAASGGVLTITAPADVAAVATGTVTWHCAA